MFDGRPSPEHVAAVLPEVVVRIEPVVIAVFKRSAELHGLAYPRPVDGAVAQAMAAAFDHAVHAALVRVGQDVHDAGDRFRSVDRRERTTHDLPRIDTQAG